MRRIEPAPHLVRVEVEVERRTPAQRLLLRARSVDDPAAGIAGGREVEHARLQRPRVGGRRLAEAAAATRNRTNHGMPFRPTRRAGPTVFGWRFVVAAGFADAPVW